MHYELRRGTRRTKDYNKPLLSTHYLSQEICALHQAVQITDRRQSGQGSVEGGGRGGRKGVGIGLAPCLIPNKQDLYPQPKTSLVMGQGRMMPCHY